MKLHTLPFNCMLNVKQEAIKFQVIDVTVTMLEIKLLRVFYPSSSEEWELSISK